MNLVERTPIESSLLRSIGYDESDNSLHVERRDGAIDRYIEVPVKHFHGLLGAESAGRYFGANIKGCFECVPVSGKTVATVYLDTETTGLKPEEHAIVEIAIVDDAGETLLHTLVNPEMPIPAEATAIHGITDADVANAPKLLELLPSIFEHVKGKELVIFNSAYDKAFLPGIEEHAAVISCAMFESKKAMGVRKWPKLSEAAEWAGYTWVGNAHSALADTLAARHVWKHVQKVTAQA